MTDPEESVMYVVDGTHLGNGLFKTFRRWGDVCI